MRARISTIVICFMLVPVCRSADLSCQPKGKYGLNAQWRLEQQKDRLGVIEQQMSQERLCVEQWYARSLAELRQTAERKARALITAETMLWTYFAKDTGDVPYLLSEIGSQFPRQAAILLSQQQMTTNQKRASLRLYEAMSDRYFLSTMRDLLMDDGFHDLLCGIAESTDVKDARTDLLRGEARRLLRVIDELRLEAARLKVSKMDKLAALKDREDYLKAGVIQTMNEIRSQKADRRGVVAAICQAEKESFCMIEGVDGLVRAGAVITGGTKVTNIREDRVEFEKDGVRWEQKVGQAAESQ